MRFIGDPEQRIREDYLRIWRYYRFCAHYHKGRIEAIPIMPGIHRLSIERIQSELLKWFKANHLQESLEVAAPLFLEQFDACVYPDLWVKGRSNLARMYFTIPDVLDWLKLSNTQKRYLKNFDLALKEKNIKYIFYEYGLELARDVAFARGIEYQEYEPFLITGYDLKGHLLGADIGKELTRLKRFFSDI